MEIKEVAQIKLNKSKPTTLDLKLLHHWVIWQYPKKTDGGFIGAVHPPLKDFGWMPAVIQPDQNEAEVHGHLPKTFKSPETAAEYCLKNGRS